MSKVFKEICIVISLCFLVVFGINSTLFGANEGCGLIFQDFEPNNGSDQYGWGLNGATVKLSTEQIHSGTKSWMVVSKQQWGGTGIQSQTQRWNMDFQPHRLDRLVFWIWASPSNSASNNLEVKFFDNGNYKKDGFSVWSAREAKFQSWTELSILFTQLPSDFNLKGIDKIEFLQYVDGIYYYDDIQVVSKDRYYQTFELGLSQCSGEGNDQFGWAWDGTCGLSQKDDPVIEGQHSWKCEFNQIQAGTGIKSQEKQYLQGGECDEGKQTMWHVDLNPMHLDPKQYDSLTFWVYSLAENEMDNGIGVQFFDNNFYFAQPARESQIVWTKGAVHYGQWTQLRVFFNDLPSDFNLNDVNKIQFQVYWPGVYYFDDIRATKSTLVIDKKKLASATVSWNAISEADEYILQENTDGPEGSSWKTIYKGSETSFVLERLSRSWLRVLWHNCSFTPDVRYTSYTSEVVQYTPSPLLVNREKLGQGTIEWTELYSGVEYIVVQAESPSGPWLKIYQGPYTTLTGQAVAGMWYRVGAIMKDQENVIIDASPWGPANSLNPGNYLKAVGTALRQDNGTDSEIVLKGVNIGNPFLNEPWMTGFSGVEDDWTIRKILKERFGADEAQNLLTIFQNAYIQEADFDILLSMGINFVRLPIYYRVIRELNENRQWIGDGFDFEKIDRIIKYCADRGIFVLIDLHGAPGAQSSEMHSGRKDYNKLFENSQEGQDYRQRTIELWQAIASHYRDETFVAGYDVLNEPFGAQDNLPLLWSFYNELYKAIRYQDPNHLIVFESIPSENDWLTLPVPSNYGWTNIMYEFHYYGFKFDDEGKLDGTLPPEENKDYLDNKLAQSKQQEYQIPVFIGEFNGFDHRTVWTYYLNKFEERGWNWTIWSYKTHSQTPSSWGLFYHRDYDEADPNIEVDELDDLKHKFSKYGTLAYHSPSKSLIEILRTATNQELTLNVAVAPNDSGSVTGNGISCPGDCIEDYIDGTSVVLKASPGSGFQLDEWIGCDSSEDGNQCITIMDTDKTVTAKFHHLILPTLVKGFVLDNKKVYNKNKINLLLTNCRELKKAVADLSTSSVYISLKTDDGETLYETIPPIPGGAFTPNAQETTYSYKNKSQEKHMDFLFPLQEKIKLLIKKIELSHFPDLNDISSIRVQVKVGSYTYESTEPWQIVDRPNKTRYTFK